MAFVAPRCVAHATLPRLGHALAADGGAAQLSPHQAPAALRALAMLCRPLLWPRPSLAPWLPALLRASLPGVDPNDAGKTLATLGFYSSLLLWLPLVGDTAAAADDAAALAAGASPLPRGAPPRRCLLYTSPSPRD